MAAAVSVRFTLLRAGAQPPRRMTEGAAGLDLFALLPPEQPELPIAPGERRLVPTGVAIALPPGYEAQVRPRSGLALKYGVTVLNSPGTIDADYRGELGVVLVNHGQEPFVVRTGERIAQLVVQAVPLVELIESVGGPLEATARGAGGYGSTG